MRILDSISIELGRLEAALSRAEGQRDAVAARAAALRQDVELAKGRLALRAEVEAFIEAAHSNASRRNLAAFETLLTALVQEVLPGEKRVSLELSTERGLVSLDVCVARPDGTLEDVLEDNGGALTNVIGMALRLVAVVKADVGRFLALDEADCWIAPNRVPTFYRVLEDGAARLGIQCLAVSHHDLSAFEGEFHVSRVTGEAAEGVGIASPDLDATWDHAQPGLRFIRLVNVQAYRDATLRLSPGVNALIGPNNRGKSTFIRALRAVFYGEARDSLVRAGTKAAMIEIGVPGQRTLRFTRQPRRTPVNIWSLHEPDGSVVDERGLRHETGGRAVPDWVEELCRIRKVEELDVHIAHQKFPVFLLGEAPSRRSAVLSIGQEASYIRDMLALHRERCLRDNTLVRSGERELIEIDEMLRGFADLGSVRESLAAARTLAGEVQASSERVRRLHDDAGRLAGLRGALAKAERRAAATSGLPEPARLSALRQAVERARERERVGWRLTTVATTLAAASARQAALDALPAALPAFRDYAAAQGMLARLAGLRQASASAATRLTEASAGLDRIRGEMARLLEQTRGLCPTCGSRIEAEALLDGHGHSDTSVAA